MQRFSSALFVSDLHLAGERPQTTAAFLSFLRGPARTVQALFILGDLFEYWAGDDDADEPLHRLVAGRLAELASNGVGVFFVAGNRDFLIGDGFAAEAGFERLADPTLVEIAGARVLVSHGDVLCTDDAAYQAYREQVRDPAWQRDFLARPLAERKRAIQGLRQRSEAEKQDKPIAIMDVNRDAVERLLRSFGYPALVHGHTHRPARHCHLVDGHNCDRWVLADWHAEAVYLRWDDAGARPLRDVAPQPA